MRRRVDGRAAPSEIAARTHEWPRQTLRRAGHHAPARRRGFVRRGLAVVHRAKSGGGQVPPSARAGEGRHAPRHHARRAPAIAVSSRRKRVRLAAVNLGLPCPSKTAIKSRVPGFPKCATTATSVPTRHDKSPMKLNCWFGPRAVVPALSLAAALTASGAAAKKPKTTKPAVDNFGRPRPEYDDTLLQNMDHGPFYSGVFNGHEISLKGVAVKLQGGRGGIAFAPLTLRFSDGWSGGFINIGGERTLGCNSTPAGEIAFSTDVGPGLAKHGTFDAPRPP